MLQYFDLNGKRFDLSHLNRVKDHANARLRNGAIKRAPIDVAFSCHCYSRMPVKGEAIPVGSLVKDGSKEMPRDRIFSESRYELSKLLPRAVRSIWENAKTVHETKVNNVVRVEMLPPILASSEYERTYIFMSLRKMIPAGEAKYIRISIESAYPDSVMYESPKFGKPVAFDILLGHCWEGRYPK
jgi:hypothetical protein